MDRKIIPVMVLAMVVLMAGSVMGASFLVTVTQPTAGNGTWVTTPYMQFNFTLNSTADNVTVQTWLNTTGDTYNTTMSNVSVYTVWQGNLTNLIDTYYDDSSAINLTIFIDTGGVNATTKTGYNFFVDSNTPVVANYSGNPHLTVTNTTGGDQAFMSSQITENNTASCGYALWYKYLESDNWTYQDSFTGSVSSLTTRTPTCNVTIEPGNFTRNAYYVLQAYATDDAGQTGWSSHNDTFMAVVMEANKWNLIAPLYVDNSTSFAEITGRGVDFKHWHQNHSSISYISKWNQSAQGFITYQVNTAANNETSIELGVPMYVYPSSDSVLIRNNITLPSTYENQTLENISTGGIWKLVGNIYTDRTLETLSTFTAYTNTVSYHNITNGYYYTYARGFGPPKNNQTVPKGGAFWCDFNHTTDVVWSGRLNEAW